MSQTGVLTKICCKSLLSTSAYVNAVRIQATLQTAPTLVSNTSSAAMSDIVSNEVQMQWIDWDDWIGFSAADAGDAGVDW